MRRSGDFNQPGGAVDINAGKDLAESDIQPVVSKELLVGNDADDEPGRNGRAPARHLAQVGALAAGKSQIAGIDFSEPQQ